MRISIIIVLSLALGFLSSCKGGKDIKSGKVAFHINPENATGTPDLEVLFMDDKIRIPLVNNAYVVKNTTTGKEIESRIHNGQTVYIDHGDINKGTFTELEGTKEILGYTCKKGKIDLSGGFTLEVYYTQDISTDFVPIGNLDGFVLEFTQPSRQGSITFTATSIEEAEYEESFFTIPNGANMITSSQFQEMMKEGVPSGSKAPDFRKPTMDGSIVALADNIGSKVTVINFWATWCGPCKMEIPNLNRLVEKYKGQDVEFIGFADDEPGLISQFLVERPFNYIQVPSSKDIAANYSITGYPTNIVIDKEGNIVVSKVGYDPEIEDILSEAIDKSL